MNERRIGCAVCAALLGAALAAQLPPEIEYDRMMVEAQDQFDAGDFYDAAMTLLRFVESKSEEERDQVPAEVWLLLARSADGLDLWGSAKEWAMKYVERTGRDDPHYRDALRILNRAEDGKAAAERASAEAEEARKRAPKPRPKKRGSAPKPKRRKPRARRTATKSDLRAATSPEATDAGWC